MRKHFNAVVALSLIWYLQEDNSLLRGLFLVSSLVKFLNLMFAKCF